MSGDWWVTIPPISLWMNFTICFNSWSLIDCISLVSSTVLDVGCLRSLLLFGLMLHYISCSVGQPKFCHNQNSGYLVQLQLCCRWYISKMGYLLSLNGGVGKPMVPNCFVSFSLSKFNFPLLSYSFSRSSSWLLLTLMWKFQIDIILV